MYNYILSVIVTNLNKSKIIKNILKKIKISLFNTNKVITYESIKTINTKNNLIPKN